MREEGLGVCASAACKAALAGGGTCVQWRGDEAQMGRAGGGGVCRVYARVQWAVADRRKVGVRTVTEHRGLVGSSSL